MRRFPFLLTSVFFLAVAGMLRESAGENADRSSTRVLNGALDLHGYDLLRSGSITLSGTWEVFWDTVAPPQCLASLTSVRKPEYIRVPHRWRQIKNKRNISSATYRLKIRSVPVTPLALRLSFWPCSYKLWINGKLAQEEGEIRPGRSRHDLAWRSAIVPLEASGSEIEIVLSLGGSIFSQFSGFSPPMLLGTESRLQSILGLNLGIKAVIGSCFLLFSIIGLLFFLLGGKRQLGYVYLGLFDLTLVVPFMILRGNDIAFLFPAIPLGFYVPLIVNDPVTFVFLFLFFRSFFPEETPKLVVTLSLCILASYIIVASVINGFIFSDLFYISDLIVFLAYILVAALIMISAVLKKRRNSLLIFSGVILFLIISLVAQYAMAYASDQPALYYLVYLGYAILIASQLFTIARDFSHAQRESTLHRERLNHAEKLATLGTVVAGVAHEVNNPNNAILLDAQTQRKALGELFPVLDELSESRGDLRICGLEYSQLKEELTKASERLVRNSQRISRIVSDLKALSKKEVDMHEKIDINAVISSAGQVIDHFIRKSTKNYHVDLTANIPPIKGNIQYLEQVIINLIKNACQSLAEMEKGVFVSTRYDPHTKQVIIEIRDQGRGIDSKTLQNLFVPFYSTKGREGTGLGLSICSNIIKSHGGRMEVTSQLDVGTDIRVFLPSSLPSS